MNLLQEIIAFCWLWGTAVLVLVAFGFAIYSTGRRKWKITLASLGLGLFMALANPIINMLVFAGQAERYQQKMLAEAKTENCIGRSTDWLQQRFGKPVQICPDESRGIEHWWYAPAPWYVLFEEDYVGFEVQKGKIVKVYMQIN